MSNENNNNNDNKKKGQSNKLASLWEVTAKNGNQFFASNKITFGELRNLLKEFKENEDVDNSDNVIFYLFPYKGDNPKAPKFHLNFKKDTWDGKKNG